LTGIANEPDLIDTVKEWALENMELVYVKPQYQIGYAIATAILSLHVANSAREAQAKESLEVKKDIDMSKIEALDKQFDSIKTEFAPKQQVKSLDFTIEV
jgi:hypothetical protein